MNAEKSRKRTVKLGLLKARCELPLAKFYIKLAAVRGLDTSDVVREALRNYRSQTEKKYEQVGVS